MRIGVLGAGQAGLVAAYRLSKLGHQVDVYERWPGLGGQAATIDVGDGVLLERYYHHLFTSDREMHALCAEIGCELETWPSSMAMFRNGALYPFNAPADLLRYKPLPPLSRIRMGLGALYLKSRADDVRPYEGITIRSWVERVMGKPAWEQVWGPLLWGKFRERADEISMAWLWAKLRNRREVSGEQAKGELLVYPRGSFEQIFRRLKALIEAQGGRVMIDRPAAALGRDPDGKLHVVPAASGSFRRGHDPRGFERAGEPERYDAVIATVPSDVFERLLDPGLAADVGDAYLERTRSIEYFAALCLLLELDRRFHPYYWTNIADSDLGFIGLIEQTNLLPAERYDGRRFLYVANYLPRDHELLTKEMEELIEFYEPGLRMVTPEFSREWIKQSWMFREPAGQPVVLPNFRDRMPAYRAGVEGLYLANTTQVYPEDRGTNYAVREAEEVVAQLLTEHGHQAPAVRDRFGVPAPA
ncbi:MAG: NAD(P)/FAD-dependent oxidoreductase [Actinomycetota bacterium]|nr:NAD(P)/FAD-dependent oxidoreductase [Actinomycetota bacterium]